MPVARTACSDSLHRWASSHLTQSGGIKAPRSPCQTLPDHPRRPCRSSNCWQAAEEVKHEAVLCRSLYRGEALKDGKALLLALAPKNVQHASVVVLHQHVVDRHCLLALEVEKQFTPGHQSTGNGKLQLVRTLQDSNAGMRQYCHITSEPTEASS